jgi:hypothetical protein
VESGGWPDFKKKKVDFAVNLSTDIAAQPLTVLKDV